MGGVSLLLGAAALASVGICIQTGDKGQGVVQVDSKGATEQIDYEPKVAADSNLRMVSALREDLRSLSSNPLYNDVNDTHRPLFKPFNSNMTVADNAREAFVNFVNTTNITKDLTGDELELFMERYLDGIASKLKNGTGRMSQTDWEKDVGTMLEDEKPAVTKKEVDIINSHSDYTWKAKVVKAFKNLSNANSKKLNGRKGVKASSRAESSLVRVADDGRATASDWEASKRTVSTSEEFDSRKQWPECAEVIGDPKDQGMCGNCWAVALASGLQSRLCISSGAKFSGPIGNISQGYLTSCVPQSAGGWGCNGGDPLAAVKWVPEHGVPTETCVPFDASGDALQHFTDSTTSAPPCPTSCSNSQYPRKLESDLFKPPKLSQGYRIYGEWSQSPTPNGFKLASEELKKWGPILLGLECFAGFMTYDTGVYEHPNPPGEKKGFHETVAIGYGSNYMISLNSWGDDWGQSGVFRMHQNSILDYDILGHIAGSGPQDKYPFPLPAGTAQVLNGLSSATQSSAAGRSAGNATIAVAGANLSSSPAAKGCGSAAACWSPLLAGVTAGLFLAQRGA